MGRANGGRYTQLPIIKLRIAITGATGFIGGHVLDELSKWDVDIVAVVRHASGCTPPVSARMEVVRFDLHDPPCDAFLKMGRPDVLMHLAWGGLPNYKSLLHFERELPAHYSFLKRLIECGLRALVVTGTCLEYGMLSGPLNEETVAVPVTPYGLAKDVLRRQLEQLKTLHSFRLIWTRLFYLYGDWQSNSSLLTVIGVGDLAWPSPWRPP